MKVMAFYIVIVVIGALACWGIGSLTEQVSEAAGLPVFLACFFLNFWVSWRIALWLTEPKTKSAT
jgi:lipopolysaccharide export LptBFGC system permease protein LptF